jgi:hypothetical protein
VLPIAVLGKESDVGAKSPTPITPLPLSGTCCGLDALLSVTVITSERTPCAIGLNATEIVQEDPSAKVEGEIGQVFEVIV